MQIKIEQINEKPIKTQRGDSIKIGVKSGGKWFGAWKGQWNQDWKVGMVLDIPDNRITTNTSNGKSYTNIEAPPKTNGQGGGGGGEGFTVSEKQELFNYLKALTSDISDIKSHLGLTGPEGF